jgi:very-short-patch-repair endonuclease
VGVRSRLPGAIHKSERADRSARRLRREPTFAERLLWLELRRLNGFHFRRQAPMGNYIVDFVCHRSRLIVEVDGGVHGLDVVAQRDAARDVWLASRGYRVLRLTNREVIGDVEAAVRRITAAAGACTPTPAPSPQGGGER